MKLNSSVENYLYQAKNTGDEDSEFLRLFLPAMREEEREKERDRVRVKIESFELK